MCNFISSFHRSENTCEQFIANNRANKMTDTKWSLEMSAVDLRRSLSLSHEFWSSHFFFYLSLCGVVHFYWFSCARHWAQLTNERTQKILCVIATRIPHRRRRRWVLLNVTTSSLVVICFVTNPLSECWNSFAILFYFAIMKIASFNTEHCEKVLCESDTKNGQTKENKDEEENWRWNFVLCVVIFGICRKKKKPETKTMKTIAMERMIMVSPLHVKHIKNH